MLASPIRGEICFLVTTMSMNTEIIALEFTATPKIGMSQNLVVLGIGKDLHIKIRFEEFYWEI